MKILKSKFSTTSTIFLFCCTALISNYSHAGFQQNSSMGSSLTSNQSQHPIAEEKKSLQIFNDRYVPESIQKKYKLEDKWFDVKSSENKDPIPLNKDVLEIRSNQITEPQIANDTWRARKGEPVRDVLQRWSERSGINLMWATPESPILKDSFSFVGRYQDAVNTLIKKEGGETIHSQYRSEGLDPVMMVPASTITTNTPPLVEPEKDTKSEAPNNTFTEIFKPSNENNEKPETRWFGLSGAPLAEVIKVWSEDANVTLIWQSEKNFALQETISHVGHFEDAVFKALSQHDNESIRPVGQLYNDPKTGKLVLIVNTEVN